MKLYYQLGTEYNEPKLQGCILGPDDANISKLRDQFIKTLGLDERPRAEITKNIEGVVWNCRNPAYIEWCKKDDELNTLEAFLDWLVANHKFLRVPSHEVYCGLS